MVAIVVVILYSGCHSSGYLVQEVSTVVAIVVVILYSGRHSSGYLVQEVSTVVGRHA